MIKDCIKHKKDAIMVAIFEALTNAVVHRDYSMLSAKVRLKMFSDRLELCCPGSLTNSMNIESLPHRQYARNQTLASLLGKCRIQREELLAHREFIMERRGNGVPTIIHGTENIGAKTPKYWMPDEDELILTIPSAHAHLES